MVLNITTGTVKTDNFVANGVGVVMVLFTMLKATILSTAITRYQNNVKRVSILALVLLEQTLPRLKLPKQPVVKVTSLLAM